MSTADQTPDRGPEPAAFPWGIPASSAPAPGADGPAAPPGHPADPRQEPYPPTPPLPQPNQYQAPYPGSQQAPYQAPYPDPRAQQQPEPQHQQAKPSPQQAPPPFQAVYAPTGTHSQPEPPMMQSPYGAPLAPGVGGGQYPPEPRRTGRPGNPAGRGRKRALLISGAVVLVAAGVAAAVAFSGGSSPSRTSIASVAQTKAGKPDGDAPGVGNGLGDNAAAPGNAAGASASGGANHGKPLTASGGNNGGATAPGVSPANGPVAAGATGTKPPAATTTAAHPTATAPHTTAPAAWHLASPPSTDCNYMNLPPSQLPQIQNGATGTEVKQLQCLLIKSMLNISTLQIDGQWGPATQAAFTDFQKCNNTATVHPPDGAAPYKTLTLDGQAGPQSFTDLYYWDNQEFNGVAYYCNGTRNY